MLKEVFSNRASTTEKKIQIMENYGKVLLKQIQKKAFMMPHKAVILSWIIYKYSNLVTNTRLVSEELSFDKNLEKLNKVNWTAAPFLPFPTFFHPRLSWTMCDVGSSYFSFNLHILKLKRKIFPNQ